MMYKPKHFVLQEWLPEEYYKTMHPVYGWRLWLIFDQRLLMTADMLREKYNMPFIMNTWHSHKMMDTYDRHEWRGFRPFTSPYVQKESTTPFGNISQHRFGRAADLVPLYLPAESVRQDILSNPFKPTFAHITCIEANRSWLHVDIRNHDKEEEGIKIVYK